MSLAKDTTYNLAAAFAPATVLLIVTPLYLDAIGPSRFGVLAICWTILAGLGFASLGMGPALTFQLATNADDDARTRSSLVWTALLLGFLASLGGAILVVIIGQIYFRYFFSAASMLSVEIRQALPILGALLPVAIINGVLNGALQGLGRFGALSAMSIFRSTLVAFAPLAVAYCGSVRLNGLILATLAANALVLIVQFAACTRLVPLGMPGRVKRSDIKALLSYGAWMSGTALIAPLVMLLDRFVIGALRGPTAVAVYVLPYNLVQQLVFLPASLTSAVLPRIAPLPNDEEVRELQSSSLVWLNGVLTPVSIVAIALAAPFFHFWIGPTLGKIAGPVAAVLLVGGWAHGIGHIPSTVVVARSRPDLLTKLLLAYLVPYVASLYLATLYFGVIGAAAAWTLRAAFDPILFMYTRPYASDLYRVGFSAALVFAAMVAALLLPWMSVLYWLAMSGIAFVGCYLNRLIVFSAARNLRRLISRERTLDGPPSCVS